MKNFIKNQLFEFFFVMLKFISKFKNPKITAYIINISLLRLKNIRKPKNKEKFVLVFEKSIGIEDLRVSFSNVTPNFNLILINRIMIRIIYDIFYDKKVKDSVYFGNNKKSKIKRKLFKEHLEQIFFELIKLKNFYAFISFNHAYRLESELQEFCKLNNIKYIVCHKESNFLKSELPLLEKALRNPLHSISKFSGDFITVYSKRAKDVLVKNKIVSNSKIFITGMPKSDFIFNSKTRKKKHVIFFLIQVRRLMSIKNKRAINYWKTLAEESIKETLLVAKKFPEIDFIFKTKVTNEKYSLRQRQLIEKANLHNCKIIYGGTSIKLVNDCICLIAYNSTSILEGLAAKKDVIVPYFKIKKDNFYYNLSMKLNNSVHLCKDSKELGNKIIRSIRNKSKPNKKFLSNLSKKLLNYHISNTQGNSSIRLAQKLNQII